MKYIIETNSLFVSDKSKKKKYKEYQGKLWVARVPNEDLKEYKTSSFDYSIFANKIFTLTIDFQLNKYYLFNFVFEDGGNYNLRYNSEFSKMNLTELEDSDLNYNTNDSKEFYSYLFKLNKTSLLYFFKGLISYILNHNHRQINGFTKKILDNLGFKSIN